MLPSRVKVVAEISFSSFGSKFADFLLFLVATSTFLIRGISIDYIMWLGGEYYWLR